MMTTNQSLLTSLRTYVVSRVHSALWVARETSSDRMTMVPLQRTRSRTLPGTTSSFRRDSQMEDQPPIAHLLRQAQDSLVQSERQRQIEVARGAAFVQAISKYRPPVL